MANDNKEPKINTNAPPQKPVPSGIRSIKEGKHTPETNKVPGGR